jgi:hypothetical protein
LTTEQIIITGILALLGSIVGSSLLVEMYKRRAKAQDDKEAEEQDISREEIVDRREMARELMERCRELEQVERKLREEKLIDAQTIAALKFENEQLKRSKK